MIKKCYDCKINKNASEFHKNRANHDGLNTQCKQCRARYDIKHRDKKKIYIKTYRLEKADEIRITTSKYRKNNKELIRAIGRNYYHNVQKNDPANKLMRNLRSRLLSVIQHSPKSDRTINLIGCTKEFLVEYIQNKWLNGMKWSSYGKEWTLDHFLPCTLFSFEDPRQQRICFHYSNLQPLWFLENILKNDSLPDGRKARDLSPEEKLDYLRLLGFNL